MLAYWAVLRCYIIRWDCVAWIKCIKWQRILELEGFDRRKSLRFVSGIFVTLLEENPFRPAVKVAELIFVNSVCFWKYSQYNTSVTRHVLQPESVLTSATQNFLWGPCGWGWGVSIANFFAFLTPYFVGVGGHHPWFESLCHHYSNRRLILISPHYYLSNKNVNLAQLALPVRIYIPIYVIGGQRPEWRNSTPECVSNKTSIPVLAVMTTFL
jgi:hypothetical protein